MILGELYFCSSHSSQVLKVSDQSEVFKSKGWTRGLVEDDQGFWVGESMMASRSKRHKKKAGGSLYYLKEGTNQADLTYQLPNCGQVNDLISIKKR